MLEAPYKKILKVIFWIAGIILFFYLIYALVEIILIVAISILLSFIFAPFIAMLEGRGLNRLTSTLIAFAVLALIIYFSLSIIIPKLVFQMNQLVAAMEGFSLRHLPRKEALVVMSARPITIWAPQGCTCSITKPVWPLTT